MSHARISVASVVRFIEDNWLDGERLGDGSFDATAGSIQDMFDFSKRHLDPPFFPSARTDPPRHAFDSSVRGHQ